MPGEVLAIIDVLGNHLRSEILRRLARCPMTAVDLAAELDVAHSSVHRNLVQLERHGLVQADAEPGRRRGNKQLVWSTDPAMVAQLGRRWIDYASGQE
jgi:predicted transcriptional regulator